MFTSFSGLLLRIQQELGLSFYGVSGKITSCHRCDFKVAIQEPVWNFDVYRQTSNRDNLCVHSGKCYLWNYNI